MPKVSVVICVYKGERFLRAALESVLAQTYPAVEIVVVNDGSPDRSDDVCKPFLDRIVHLEQGNQGLARARNRGIRESSGEYIALIDQDDLWAPDKLEKQMALFESNPSPGLVYSDYDQIDSDGRIVRRRTEEGRMRRGMVLPDLYEHNFISTVSSVFSRRALDRVGVFNERLHFSLDWDLWLRIAAEFPVDYVDESLAFWRWRPNHAEDNHEISLLEAYRIVSERQPQLASKLTTAQNSGVANRLARISFSLGRLYGRRKDTARAQEWVRTSIRHDLFTEDQTQNPF